MNFRQRMAWIAVVFYLTLTCWIVYYIFEISDSYNIQALDHVDKYHGDKRDADSADNSWAPWRHLGHLMDIPLPVWLLIAFLPYIQIFAMILACTKPQPLYSLAFLWPIYIVLKIHGTVHPHGDNYRKAVNTFVPTGHILIDT